MKTRTTNEIMTPAHATRCASGLACSGSLVADPSAQLHPRPQPPGRDRRRF